MASRTVTNSQSKIHRAPWIIAETHAGTDAIEPGIIADGALLVQDGRIRAVGRFSDIIRKYSGIPVAEHEGKVLAPALINSHAHLELSHLDLSGTIADSYDGDITVWIRELLAAREEFAIRTDGAEKQILERARLCLADLYNQGVAFVGDVGNSLESSMIGKEQPVKVRFLLEILGLSSTSEEQAFARLEQVAAGRNPVFGCTAHAPYSTTPALIQELKRAAAGRGQVFSIHVAESEAEKEFLQSGTGPFVDFLHDRGAWDATFVIPAKGPVHYLDSLGVLDTSTICVHAVHVEQDEIEVIAKRRSKVCLCPGSNRFIGVGNAPVTDFLARGILPGLGTDSRASNNMLNMWREMSLLREDHPGLTPGSVFCMATRGGAEAWGLEADLGTLAPGKQAKILAIDCHHAMGSAEHLMDYITTEGDGISVEWVI